MTDTPLTEQQLDEITTRAAHLHEYATLTDGPLQADADQLTGEDVPVLVAGIRRQRTELAAVEMLAPQQCPAGLHADWLVDSEYAHACPWCQIESLRARLAERTQVLVDTDVEREWLSEGEIEFIASTYVSELTVYGTYRSRQAICHRWIVPNPAAVVAK